jgi:hypothetical protein
MGSICDEKGKNKKKKKGILNLVSKIMERENFGGEVSMEENIHVSSHNKQITEIH